MAFFIFVLTIDVIATVASALKGRILSAMFGVIASGSVIWLRYRGELFLSSSSVGYFSDGYAPRFLETVIVFLLVFLPLSAMVIRGALRNALAKSWWANKQEGPRMAKIDKLVAEASEHLDGDEEVLIAVDGTSETGRLGAYSRRAGVLIATDKRLLFYAKEVTEFELESFPYETISSFERGKRTMVDSLKFHSSGNKVSMKWIQATNLDEFVATVKSKMDEA